MPILVLHIVPRCKCSAYLVLTLHGLFWLSRNFWDEKMLWTLLRTDSMVILKAAVSLSPAAYLFLVYFKWTNTKLKSQLPIICCKKDQHWKYKCTYILNIVYITLRREWDSITLTNVSTFILKVVQISSNIINEMSS